MTGTVTEISAFRFSSLRKYMHPIYAALNESYQQTVENKRVLLRRLVPEFFKRLRVYRGISLEELSKRSGLAEDFLIEFEQGETESQAEIESAYRQFCAGTHEVEYFAQLIHEFMNPSIKDAKDTALIAAYHQYGLVLPGIDYNQLFTPKGRVLSFPSNSPEHPR